MLLISRPLLNQAWFVQGAEKNWCSGREGMGISKVVQGIQNAGLLRKFSNRAWTVLEIGKRNLGWK